MEWDLKMAKYFEAMMRSKGCEIYDLKCFDANIPPINSDQYMSEDFTKNCIVNHLALNAVLQEQLRE